MSEAFLETTTSIVAAYVSNNSIRPDDLLAMLRDVHEKLVELSAGPKVEPVAEKPKARMPWRKTIHDDYLISLEDGKHYRTLKRHLSGLGMSPQEYKDKWDLPGDYPIVCKAYSVKRSELAKSLGLGRKPAEIPETVSAPEPVMEDAKPEAAPRPARARAHPKPKDTKAKAPEAAESEAEAA